MSATKWGAYPDRPLRLVDLVPPDGRRFIVDRDFSYDDAAGKNWLAPQRLLTDGASIPMPFWSVIGGPWEGLYREGAVVHDAYCCSQTRPWQEVHRMFYAAMRCSGVGWAKAKTMFYAVWWGGPRWTALNPQMPQACLAAHPAAARPLRSRLNFLPPRDVTLQLWQTILTRPLTIEETRAAARAFLSISIMTNVDAATTLAELKERRLSPEDLDALALSVMLHQRLSEEHAREIRQWIAFENPPLDAIISRAEEMRHQRIETEIFPELREELNQNWTDGEARAF